MKKALIYIFAMIFLLSVCGTVGAVDKKDKTTPPVTENKNQKKQDTKDKSQESKPAPTQKKYDDFVDKNNNGIDDRKENLKEKPSDDTPQKTTKP